MTHHIVETVLSHFLDRKQIPGTAQRVSMTNSLLKAHLLREEYLATRSTTLYRYLPGHKSLFYISSTVACDKTHSLDPEYLLLEIISVTSSLFC